MPQGGGFCKIHGPYDPPHLMCPYCAMQSSERRIFGPPPGVTRVAKSDEQRDRPADQNDKKQSNDDFVRETVEPDLNPGATEVAPSLPTDEEAGDAPVDDVPLPPLAWLVVKEPAAKRGTIVKIKPNQSIGREGDVQLDDPKLSRQHARLTLEPPDDEPSAPPEFYLWPFAPTNPVYINGQAIRGATALHENDEIRLGSTLFVFKMLRD